MADNKTCDGQCACGAISIKAENIEHKVGACHCSTCRKMAAGPYLSVQAAGPVELNGKEYMTTYQSSDWAERSFCSRCGTHLFYRLKEPELFYISVGLFDDAEDLVFDHQIFIDSKPDFYEFKNKTHDMTGAEVFAMFAPNS